ncbi:MAG TPA: sensor histidine kinase [Dermatophilaceae bacterium]
MTALTRPSSWRDWAVPAVLLAGAQLEIWVPGLTKSSGPRVVFALVAIGAAMALVVRRSHPLVSEVAVCALVGFPLLRGWYTQSTALVLMLVVALFACGRYGARTAAYLGVPLASAMVLLSAGPDPDQTLTQSWGWSLNTVWIFALGAGFRHERLLREEASSASESRMQAEAAQERLRVARELHDVLSHSLSVVVVQAEVADTFVEVEPLKSREAIRQVATTARAALSDTRRIVEILRDPDRDPANSPPLGLPDVPALVDRLRQSGLPVSLTIGSPLPALSPEAAATAYRVVQEGLTNVLRHAGQVPTNVTVARTGDAVVIDIHDQGNQPAPRTQPSGHGLSGMRERVSSCGGDVTSGPCDDGGFRVRAVLPAQDQQ